MQWSHLSALLFEYKSPEDDDRILQHLESYPEEARQWNKLGWLSTLPLHEALHWHVSAGICIKLLRIFPESARMAPTLHSSAQPSFGGRWKALFRTDIGSDLLGRLPYGIACRRGASPNLRRALLARYKPAKDPRHVTFHAVEVALASMLKLDKFFEDIRRDAQAPSIMGLLDSARDSDSVVEPRIALVVATHLKFPRLEMRTAFRRLVGFTSIVPVSAIPLQKLIAGGRNTLTNFDLILEKAVAAGNPGLQLLKKWHTGSFRQAAFLERTLSTVFKGPVASIMRSFIMGGNELGAQHKSVQEALAAQRHSQSSSVEQAVHGQTSASSASFHDDGELDARTQMLVWASAMERLILSGWHLDSLPRDPAMQWNLDLFNVSEQASDESSEDDSKHSDAESEISLCDYGEPIFLLHFQRCGGALTEALLHGRALEPVRLAASCERQEIRLFGGGFIFVHTQNYRKALALVDRPLFAYHVIVTQTFLPLLREELSTIRRRRNVTRYSREVIGVISHDGTEHAQVRNSFLERDDATVAGAAPTTVSEP